MTKWRCRDTCNGATMETRKISATASNWGDVIRWTTHSQGSLGSYRSCARKRKEGRGGTKASTGSLGASTVLVVYTLLSPLLDYRVFWLKTRTIEHEVIADQLWRTIIERDCSPIAFRNCSGSKGGGTVRKTNLETTQKESLRRGTY